MKLEKEKMACFKIVNLFEAFKTSCIPQPEYAPESPRGLLASTARVLHSVDLEWGLRIFISVCSQVALMMMIRQPHFENYTYTHMSGLEKLT